MANSELESTTNGETGFTICTFCNNSTNGFEKRLFATEQPKGPFFPVLVELQGSKTKLDLLGRAVVCVACFHHLLRQWSSFERRGIPVRKREYNIITDDRVNNYQARREEEIRKEAEQKIKEIQDREERIRQEAEHRFEKYRQRQAEIRREAEKRLLEEQAKADELKKQTSTKLKEEQQREDELRRQAEERIQEEKEKRDYIRQEAERLLREEKLLESEWTKQESQPSAPEFVTTYRTEVIIPAVDSVKESTPLKEITSQGEFDDMEGVVSEKELSARSKSRKMMVFDPETGCYRKKSESEDKENTAFDAKTERVEYRFRLRSDEKRGKATEAKDSSSKPDKASTDIQVAMEPSVSTEQSIMINGKNKSQGEAEGDEEDLKKAGDIMKAKFEEGRKKFEQEPLERKGSDSSKQRTTRRTSDDSLEEKIKEMEKRRERLLQRGPSMELELRRQSEEKKDVSPREEPGSPRNLMDDTAKKQRSRSERNKRRLTAEELSLRKSSGSEEDAQERSRSISDTAKVPKTDTRQKPEENKPETKKETFTIQLNRTEKPDEIFVTQVKPVEQSPVNLMSWDDDSTDGPFVPEKDPPVAFRKRADSTEGETFPKPLKLVEIEAPISVTQKSSVQSAPVVTGNILDMDDDEGSSMSTPVIESISTWDNKARASSTAEEDRRRREKEHEERKRRIEENQRKAAKAKKQGGSDVSEKPRSDEPVQEMTMKEKRRSLVDMWESFSEPQTNVMSFEEDEEMRTAPQRSSKVLVRENKTMSFDPWEQNGDGEDMEVDEEEKCSSTRPAVAELNQKLSEEEQRWESAGKIQPGRLQKTVFHSLSEDVPTDEPPKAKPRKGTSRYDWMKGESYADQEALVPTKLKLDWQSDQATDEIHSKIEVKASSPEPVEMESKTESRNTPSSSGESESSSEGESESEEDRKPRIDTDEFHKLTEEETQWESAGHFQPKKLNIAQIFQQTTADAEDIKPVRPVAAPRKKQETPQEMEKKPPQTSPVEVFVPSKARTEEIAIGEISPVNEVKTETEPHTPGTYIYEEESDDDDDIPGWRRVEEQRRQQEREEIERAKLEEKRRMEREAMEENEEDETDSSDDEFESKVRTQAIQKINPNLLGQFMKEPEREPEKPVRSVKPKEQNIEVSDVQLMETTPSVDTSSDESEEEEEHERSVEDEYEEKVKSGQIRKLKLDNSPFLQAKEDDTAYHVQKDVPRGSRIVVQEERDIRNVERTIVESAPPRDLDVGNGYTNEPEIDTHGTSKRSSSSEDESEEDDDVPAWRKMEEKRRQQEKEEMERAKLEEQRRREREASESDEGDSDSADDEFEAKVRTKEIRKINPNLLFQFMGESGDKEKPLSANRPPKEKVEIQRAPVSDSSSSEDSDKEDTKGKDAEDNEDEYDLKVKSGQVKKLVLDNSPFAQKTTTEEPQVVRKRPEEKKPTELKQESRTAIVQEDVLVQVVDNKVVESEPDLVFHEPGEDDEYEVKVKSKLVKRLSVDQFTFLRQQEEEARKKAQEEERRKVEREEREKLKKEEELRRRLEAEARAKEEERIRREEEMRRKEEEERARKEEERRRKVEEAERLRQEQEERMRREEEEEQMRLEEMRRQKQAAKKKFETGVFDDIAVKHSENDIYSVGRLDSNKLWQFQQSPSDEPKPKSKTREKENNIVEEYKVPEPETETVVMTSVDLIETSPYDEDLEQGLSLSEDLEYEEKRKSVGKLDKDWYIKQQMRQSEEHDRRARELEEQRLREERNEMLRIKEEKSKQRKEDEPSVEVRDRSRSDSERRRSKLSVDKFSRFEQDTREEPRISRKKKDKSDKGEKQREDLQAAPLVYDEKEKRKSTSSEDGSVVILARDVGETTQQKMRLQREREETELLRREEERRRLAAEEELYADEADSDKPKNVGKLNQHMLEMFQRGGPVAPTSMTRKQAPQTVQEVISVQSQEDVESTPFDVDHAEVGPAVTQEDAEYEQRINTGKRLDVDKFLDSRSQEAVERTQRAKKLQEDRMRQEQEELAKLRAEENKRLKQMEEELDEGEKSAPTTAVDSERPRKISIERRPSKPEEPEPERNVKEVSVGRLPKELRSAFEGERSKTDGSDSRRKSSKSKGSRSHSHSKSSRRSSSDSHDRDLNGSVSPREQEALERESIDRREPIKETQDESRSIESYTPEEKPLPKKLNTSMLAAFEKSDDEAEVQLRRAKSEKRARPKSIGNVDLLRWQDDSNLRQPSSGKSKKEKTGSKARPKSIAY